MDQDLEQLPIIILIQQIPCFVRAHQLAGILVIKICFKVGYLITYKRKKFLLTRHPLFQAVHNPPS